MSAWRILIERPSSWRRTYRAYLFFNDKYCYPLGGERCTAEAVKEMCGPLAEALHADVVIIGEEATEKQG